MDRTRDRDWGAVEGIVARTHRFVPASEAAPAVLRKIKRLRSWRPNPGLPTGLSLLDQETGGLQPGCLTLLAGGPGSGKTTLALQIARETLLRREEPLGVAFFSLAEAREAIITRLLAQEAGVQLHPLRTGYFHRERWSEIESASQRLSEVPLYIEDGPCLTAKTIADSTRALAAGLKSQDKALGLVIIDYLQLVYGPGGRIGQRPQETERVGRTLQKLAQGTGAAVLVLVQMESGETEGNDAPTMVDLGLMMPLERTADLVLLVNRCPGSDNERLGQEVSLIVTKGPGRTGIAPAIFRPHLPIFDDAPGI